MRAITVRRSLVYGSLQVALLAASLSLLACGSNGAPPTQAASSDITIAGASPGGAPLASTAQGVTPFISSVQLAGASVSLLQAVTFTIAPKPGATSAPVSVQWSISALDSRGYHKNGAINLPIFGLYAAYTNQISLVLQFNDGSTQTIPYTITTAAYTDPYGVYDQPTIIKSRAPGSALGFNFFLMKSTVGGPVIVDTDAEIRWAAPPGIVSAESSIYAGGQFLIGSETSTDTFGLQWDGTQSAHTTLQPNTLAEYTHNIDPGKVGLLAEFSGVDSYGNDGDAIVSEIVAQTDIAQQTISVANVKTWDMAAIIETYMNSQGDNGAAFVRPNVDWFHLNATTYDPSDDTVIVSSRENFVIKVDYRTGNIVWILGDPTKYWYTFPSLRAKALTLAPGGLYPVGQHGISINSDGYLMLFNDGLGSINQPAGTPAGITRTYSAVSAYSIDAATLTATQEWGFDYGQTIYSAVCGSVYEAAGSYLVNFSTAANFTRDRLVGLDAKHNVAFDFQYLSQTPCGTSWNAIPIPLDNLQIAQ
jgi:arylsulfate sulfotransferase